MTHPMFSTDDVDVLDVVKEKRMVMRDTAIGRISVNLDRGDIKLTQRWKYHFTRDEIRHPTHQVAAAWTDDEQRDFHYAARSIIWKFWNSRTLLPGSTDPSEQALVDLLNAHAGICFTVSGASDFAQKFAGRQLPIEFEILIANRKRTHYVVNVKKMLPGRTFRSFVDPGARTINLSKADNEASGAQQAGPGAASTSEFFTTPHEFGHALGYGIDEYEFGNMRRADIDSLMNIGKEVRPRHLKAVERHLSQMIPRTTFALPA